MGSSPTTLPPPPSTPRVSFSTTPSPTKMSVTQTFYLAHKARGKLSSEAARSDHNLRLLVGHANLLDNLMIRLADAEAEQERWFTNTVRGNEEWTDADHEPEEYGSLAADYDSDTESEEDEESDEESDEDDMDYSYTERSEMPRLSRMPVIGMHKAEAEEMDYDEDMLDDDEDDEGGMYELTRVTSHRPPSLCSDCSDDEDETHPPSPPQPAKQLLMSEKELHAHGYFPTESPIDEDHHHHHGVGVLFDDALPMISSY